MSDEYTVGLVGNGAVSRLHARTLLHQEGVRLLGVAGPNLDRVSAFASEFGLAVATTNPHELFSHVDVAIIASPSAFHHQQTAAAIAQDCHVLVEMPATASASQAEQLRDLAEGAGRVLASAHTVRWGAANLSLRKAIARGSIGLLQRFRIDRRVRTDKRRWRDDPLLHHGQHAIDLVRFVAGGFEPKEVQVSLSTAERSCVTVSGELPDAAQTVITVCHGCPESSQLIVVTGESGTIRSDGFGNISSRPRGLVEPISIPQEIAYFDSIQAQDRAFLAGARIGIAIPSMDETIANLTIIDELSKMAGEKERERRN